MSFARVAYPPPPPTHNDLSSVERSNLIRSTKKLGKVLGTTPGVLDVRPGEGSIGRPSLTVVTDIELENLDRTSLCRRTPSVSSTSTSMSDDSTDTRFSLSSTRSDADSLTSAESSSWQPRKVTRKPAPLFQTSRSPSPATASIRPLLETIPASPPFDSVPEDSAIDSHSRSLSFASFGPPRPLAHVEFDIPSDASVRRSKMDRLRRKLGDGVPVELVFPDDENAQAEVLAEDEVMAPTETRLWTQQERLKRRSTDVRLPSPLNSAVVCCPMSTVSPSSALASPALSTVTNSTARESKLSSGFSLQRPLFAVVEADDYVSGCFEFSMRKHRAAYIKEFGRQRTVQ
ncbi:hypothetical protein HWV62_9253 [Athelia sp. TMB]|nr:hypothetical protein HWV62_24904 [Athelia sp. TMB]KAF7975562.1 hypothetical protein HWV62_9253 [Athelia sp. TMB]